MIIFILPSFSGGGAERVTLNLLTGLKKQGFSVGILVFKKEGPLLSMVPNQVPIYDLHKSTLSSSFFPLIAKIKQLEPQIVFSSLGYVNVALLLARWSLPKKTKIWVREANLPSISLLNNSHKIVMIFLYKKLYRKADKLICSSFRMKEEFVSKFSVSDEIIEVIPNPIDVNKLRFSALPKERFDNGGVCYVASGRLTYQKGFERLLDWFNLLGNKKSTLVILGDGKLKEQLIIISESLGIQDRVKFLGFCNNPWKWYAGADVFLLPSYWEGMPNVALEALACGIPVIATAESGGINEVKNQAKSGALTVVKDEVDFIKAMNEAIPNNTSKLCNSLLPSSYELDSVLHEIKSLLNDQ
jgi:glycosyltransferase involved in cell wall biosynthesis